MTDSSELNAVEIRELLTRPLPTVSASADLLDDQDRPVETVELGSVSVERSMYASVHGTCDLTLYRDLDWGRDRVRIWQTVDGVRFPRGVFILTTPERKAGEFPQGRSVVGYDKMWLLQREIGDTYVISAGVSYLDAIRGVLADAGVFGVVHLDGTRQETLLADPAVWLLTDQPAKWIRAVNDLLAMIGYRGMWVDATGRFRSQPYRPPSEVGPVWTFDLSDFKSDIVYQDRTVSEDVWDAPNWWRFVRRQAVKPVEGAGIYTVDRVGTDLPRRKTVYLDAADQGGLVAQGDATVSEDTSNVKILQLRTGPLPIAGHFDVMDVKDFETVVGKVQVRRWSDDLLEGSMSWDLEAL